MTAATPPVSIAIRAYRAVWVGEAISSVLCQTFEDLELVVYDDARNLERTVAAFEDPRIRYVRAERHLEASGRFSAAAALCRGRYIGMLDDDDRYEPEFVARLVEALETNRDGGVAFCRELLDVDGELQVVANELRPGPQPWSAADVIGSRRLPRPSQMLVRRRMLRDSERVQPMPDGVSPDRFLHIHGAAAGWKQVYVDQPLVVCRQHDAQISRSGRRTHDRKVATFASVRLADPRLEAARRRQHALALIRRAIFSLTEGDRASARADLNTARSLDPAALPWLRRLARATAAIPGSRRVASAATRAKGRLPGGEPRPPGPTARTSDERPEQKVAAGAASLALGSGTALLLTIAVAPVLTRLFDPAAIGAAGVLAGVMAAAGFIACLRYDVAIPLARDGAATRDICSASALAAVGMTAVLGGLSLAFGPALCEAANISAMSGYVWLVPLSTALAGAGLVATGLLVREGRYGKLAQARVARAVGQSATQVGAGIAIAGAGAAWLSAGVVAGTAAYSVSTLAFAGRTPVGMARRAPRSLARRVRQSFHGARRAARGWGRFAAWSTLAAALQGASLAAPPLLVAALYGPVQAGLFVVVQRLLAAPAFLGIEAVGAAWYGTAAEIVRENRGGLRRPLARITRTMLLWGGIVLGAVTIAGPPLLGPVFGPEWADAGGLVVALAPLYFSLFAAAPASVSLQARGRTDLITGLSAGRLIAPVVGIPTGHALGFSLAGSLACYTAGMVIVSVIAAVLAWRLSE